MNKTLIATLCAAALLLGCGDPGHEQTQTPAEEEAGHDHDPAPGAEKITHFTDRTELFVEFPRLVVGETSAFAAHLSRLSDFRAVTDGQVGVRLSGGGQPDELFTLNAPSQPGIFRPEVTPRQAGERKLAIEVRTPEFALVHELGPVTVYADRQAAEAAPAPQEDEGTSFTKEQQWKVDFATAEVVRRTIRTAISATARVRARPDGEALLSAPAAGRVQPASAFPSLGREVAKGETLAYLVPRLGGETDLATLRAEADKSRVAEKLASQELARLEALFRDEAVAEKRVQAARAETATARAQHEAARLRLGQYDGAGGGIPLRTPLAGTLVDVNVSPGAFVQDGAPLFHIADRGRLWLEARVPESEAGRLGTPSGAAFRLPGAESGIEILPGVNGRLVAVGGVVDAASRTLPVVFEFTAPGGAPIPIGLAVQAQVFAGGNREALAIPASSVLDEGGLAVVFVQTGGESFERHQVRLGARDGDWVEVLDGLTPGNRVVSRGAWLVKLAATGTAQIGHGHAH